jgi:hypothetical protein
MQLLWYFLIAGLAQHLDISAEGKRRDAVVGVSYLFAQQPRTKAQGKTLNFDSE